MPVYANGKLAVAHLVTAGRLPRRSVSTAEARRCLDAARRDRGTVTVEWPRRGDDLLAAVRSSVASRRGSGRGVAVYDQPEGTKSVGELNVALAIAMCGYYPAADTKHYREAGSILQAARGELGGEAGGLNTAISANPVTGQAWRPRFSAVSLAHESRMLQTACFIVVTYLSGMRVDEVLALRPGCSRQDISADGLIYLHHLASTLLRGSRNRLPPPGS